MAVKRIEELLKFHKFWTFKEIRSSQIEREKGYAYLCIVTNNSYRNNKYFYTLYIQTK